MKLPRRALWRHVYRLYEAIDPWVKLSVPVEEKPQGARVLVLAPHIDDEVIGCGGTAIKHRQAGDRLWCLYLAGCTDERVQEAERARAIIGFHRLIFWGYQTRTLRDHPEAAETLAELLREYRPDLIYVPFFLERHHDHVATNHLLILALRRPKVPGCMIYAYEVWTPLVANVLVDITDQAEAKREALRQFQSQIRSIDWEAGILALNRYRATVSKARQYAEAFFRATSGRYARLWEQACGGKSPEDHGAEG